MTVVVLSPHTDDAVFSIGDHLAGMAGITVVSTAAAVPADPAGKAKHETLRAEHATAMSITGADYINGPFLDDVYPSPDLGVFNAWVSSHLAGADMIYVPVGIHHFDHLMVSNAAIAHLLVHPRPTVRFYAEQPYWRRYPGLARDRFDWVTRVLGALEPIDDAQDHRDRKEAALRVYASQTDEALIAELMAPERIWELA